MVKKVPPPYANLGLDLIVNYTPPEDTIGAWHTVSRRRESFLAIATQYRVPVARLIEFNFLGSVRNDTIKRDIVNLLGPAIAAAKAGNAIQAAKLLREGTFQLEPSGFDREPQATQTRVLDNARTVPLLLAAPPSPAITCDMLKNFARSTLVMRGDKTQPYFAVISDAISKCVPAARLDVLKDVQHAARIRIWQRLGFMP